MIIEMEGKKYEVSIEEGELKGRLLSEEKTLDRYVIVRTYSAGVFAGYLVSRAGREAVLRKARRIWYWDGASSLSELAMKGSSREENCKFPCEVDRVELLEVIEILDCTEEAKKSIDRVKVWTQHQ